MPNFFDIKIRETNPKIKEYFENKVIFLVCIQGDYLINPIKEVLTLYNCSIYNFPHNINLFEKINEVNKIKELTVKAIEENKEKKKKIDNLDIGGLVPKKIRDVII